jgi:spermidine dehydrogenase
MADTSSRSASITRRDFLDGVALAIGAPLAARANDKAQALADPAARTGLQGQTDAAMAAAHAWRDEPARWRGTVPETDAGIEDLVIVGGGISGMAGAYLFQRHAGRPVRMLLIDPLDDFGGHARRNEFVSRSGVRLVGYGGSQSLDSPGLFSPAVHALLRDLGIELRRFETEFYDAGWTRRHGVRGRGLYFDGDGAGAGTLVVRAPGEKPDAWVAKTPLTPRSRAQLLHLLTSRLDVLPGLSAEARRARLAGMTYRAFLADRWRVDASVQQVFEGDTRGYFGVGIDATSALDAWASGLPGFAGMRLARQVDKRMSPSGRLALAGQDDYVYHFPDGNAGVARALLRALLPAALPGSGMTSLADGRVDFARLDEPAQAVRLRLRATAVQVAHLGVPGKAELVEVRYVDGTGKLRAVRARQVLLACWHRVIARLTGELPAAQRDALADQVKVPLVYANVLLSNWRPWQRAGVHSIKPIGSFWDEAALDFPVSMDSLRFASAPDQPLLVHLGKVVVPGNGLPARDQAALGRAELARSSFSDYEAQIRRLLQGALGAYGFDADRDIEAITVNRWAHGYAYEYMRPWDPFWPQGALPCVTARRGWGRIAIANSDAGAYAYAHSAIDQAARAVQELLPNAALPAWATFPGPNPRALGLA